MGSKARVMVNVLVNARGHANVLIDHEDALIHGNANIMEDTANIGTITGIIIVNAPDQGNVIIDVKRSIMMIGTSIGNLIPDENVHPEKIAIVVNIVSKKNENDLDIESLSLIKLFCFCTTCKTLISVHISRINKSEETSKNLLFDQLYFVSHKPTGIQRFTSIP